jgi:hypothetical protein
MSATTLIQERLSTLWARRAYEQYQKARQTLARFINAPSAGRTFMRRTRLLPGNTYSDMLGRRPRSAESMASLTLGDCRFFLTEEIERYHTRTHRTLETSPKAAWERAWRRGRGSIWSKAPKQLPRCTPSLMRLLERLADPADAPAKKALGQVLETWRRPVEQRIKNMWTSRCCSRTG